MSRVRPTITVLACSLLLGASQAPAQAPTSVAAQQAHAQALNQVQWHHHWHRVQAMYQNWLAQQQAMAYHHHHHHHGYGQAYYSDPAVRHYLHSRYASVPPTTQTVTVTTTTTTTTTVSNQPNAPANQAQRLVYQPGTSGLYNPYVQTRTTTSQTITQLFWTQQNPTARSQQVQDQQRLLFREQDTYTSTTVTTIGNGQSFANLPNQQALFNRVAQDPATTRQQCLQQQALLNRLAQNPAATTPVPTQFANPLPVSQQSVLPAQTLQAPFVPQQPVVVPTQPVTSPQSRRVDPRNVQGTPLTISMLNDEFLQILQFSAYTCMEILNSAPVAETFRNAQRLTPQTTSQTPVSQFTRN